MIKGGMQESVAERELAKFFAVSKHLEDLQDAKMPRCEVDTVWHRMLKNPERHARFAKQHFGAELTHVEGEGTAELQWVPIYEKLYGELPQVWFMRPDGEFDAVAYSNYLNTGVYRAS